MTYERAQQILGFTSPMSRERRAELAKVRLENRVIGSPLRYGVACRVLIDGAKQGN